MILTIISTLLGLLSSAVPSLLRYYERKQEIRYEVDITRLKVEAASKGYEISARISDQTTLGGEGSSLREHDMSLGGSGFINALRASVRPVITYSFFFLFLFVKGIVIFVLVTEVGVNINNIQVLANIVFDEATTAIFGTIIGFWFGIRSYEKAEELASNWNSSNNRIKKL